VFHARLVVHDHGGIVTRQLVQRFAQQRVDVAITPRALRAAHGNQVEAVGFRERPLDLIVQRAGAADPLAGEPSAVEPCSRISASGRPGCTPSASARFEFGSASTASTGWTPSSRSALTNRAEKVVFPIPLCRQSRRTSSPVHSYSMAVSHSLPGAGSRGAALGACATEGKRAKFVWGRKQADVNRSMYPGSTINSR